MGCTQSSEQKSSSSIDKELAAEKKTQEREIKLLLLGAGDSGKSTIAKQMRYIHTKGFSDDEIKSFRDIMQSNVLQCVQLLIRNLENYDMEVAAELRDRSEYYANANPYELPLAPHMCDELSKLWKDPSIQELYNNKRHEFNLPEVAGYCLANIERIGSENYNPTQEDILKCRQRTTGMKETVFVVDDVKFRLLDVGGQKNERKKWIHYFEDVKTIIFCVALGDYNMNLVEDGATNRMMDSMKLWRDIVNNEYFKNTSFVLFLNKNDIFREKITKEPLNQFFPEYTGGFDYEKGLEFVRNQYLSHVPSGKTVVAHVTTATDTENISVVFDAVRRSIINQILKIHF
ncbi:G-protein subunit alpha 9 [Heterostelium album PN500]|uniref:G-protein subunit alpha 9 n=1 Tax=Heterostelium pallidum (strain ATCC 26659 / Pp 5 / PN500) TaxID=670386 RepID=D3BRR4_HETP5|nr:G-protein subunit alpha 9 [Heterostelium album PN500]EFA76096.1 G-protein subunit alpha 9 [Heterostelium album PN500]|eukprot:XP_020428230.1 G-protein subunit alpha 9 [Heterostelium album PN500]